MSDELPIPGDASRPRYFHRELGLVEHISGTTVRQRDAAKRRLAKLVTARGGKAEDIEYRAGMGPGLLGGRRR